MIVLLYAVIFLILISFFFSRENLKYYFTFAALLLAILAFLYVPTTKMDLYRHFTMLKMARTCGFEYVMTSEDYKSLPVAGMYMYLISLLRVDGFLPGITAFIVYKLSFSLVYMSGMRYNTSKSGMLLSALFYAGTANYLGTISGIRNPLALTIFIYFLYIELVEKKHIKVCWIAYIMTCLIHVSMLLLIVVRILVWLYSRYTRNAIKILLISWSGFMPIMINSLAAVSSIPIINLLVTKANSYTSEEAEAVANVSLYTMVYATILIVAAMVFIYYGLKTKNRYKEVDKDFFNYGVMILCYVIGAISNYHLFVRMTRVLVLLSIPIINCINKRGTFNHVSGYINIWEIIMWAIFIESVVFMAFLFHGQYMFFTIFH